MRELPLEDHVIGIAKILKVTEKEVMELIFEEFKNTSDKNKVILDDMYWEFQDDNKSPNLKY
jgi:hypothetical protein